MFDAIEESRAAAVPPGYNAAHPMADELRRKSFVARHPLPDEILQREDAFRYCMGVRVKAALLVAFLTRAADGAGAA